MIYYLVYYLLKLDCWFGIRLRILDMGLGFHIGLYLDSSCNCGLEIKDNILLSFVKRKV